MDVDAGAMKLHRTIPASLTYMPELYRSRLILLGKNYAY